MGIQESPRLFLSAAVVKETLPVTEALLRYVFLECPEETWPVDGPSGAMRLEVDSFTFFHPSNVLLFVFSKPHGFYMEFRPAQSEARVTFNPEKPRGFVDLSMGGERERFYLPCFVPPEIAFEIAVHFMHAQEAYPKVNWKFAHGIPLPEDQDEPVSS